MDRSTASRALAVVVLAVSLLSPCAAAAAESRSRTGSQATGKDIGTVEALDPIKALIRDGHYAEAEAAARQLLPVVEREHGTEGLEVADVLDLLLEALWRGSKDQMPEARQLAERAVAMKEKALDPADPKLVPTVRNLAFVLADGGDIPGAEALFKRVIVIQERAFGVEDPEVARGLIYLANLFLNSGQYIEARPLFERALAIQEKAFGPRDSRLALTLHNLALMHQNLGEYQEARKLYERALAIRKENLGEKHLDVAWTLNGIATLSEETGDYDTARALYQQSLAIRENALGTNHLYVVWSLNNLAHVYQSLGDYSGARELYERALAINEMNFGAESLGAAMVRSNLAELFCLTGDYAQAKPLIEESLRIRQKILGSDHPDVASSLHHLAALLQRTGDRPGARRLYERAINICERKLGLEHQQVAWNLNGLANLLRDIGETETARPLYERSLAIRQKALGPKHAEVAESLDSLGNILHDAGDSDAARRMYESALAIRKEILGPDHPLVGETLTHLADVLASLGRSDESLDAGLRAEEISRNHLRLTARTLSERQALHYASVRASGLDVALSILSRGPSEGQVERTWDSWIRSRALVLDEVAARHRARSRSDAPGLSELDRALTRASRRLANLVVHGPDPDHPERYRSLLDDARREKEDAERALAAQSLPFRRELARDRVGSKEVLAGLPRRSALVAYALYRKRGISKSASAGPREGAATIVGRAGSGAAPSAFEYLAFVLREGSRQPRIVSLGSASEIEPLISRWLEEARHGALSAGRSAEEAERIYRYAGKDLREKVWDPVSRNLGGVRRVFIVPDGAVSLVSLAALPADGPRYVLETGPLLHYLSAERDLVRPPGTGHRGEGLLALGGPSFDHASLPTPSDPVGPGAPGGSDSKAPTQLYRGGRSSCGSFQSMLFPELPASVSEVEVIAHLWQEIVPRHSPSDTRKPVAPTRSAPPVLLTGVEASEAAFKRMAQGKRILHLATHGFFLGGSCSSALDHSRGIGALVSIEREEPDILIGENPLLLSGLALAGANRRDLAGPDDEDGILTAEEIAAIDLDGVDWAVLSACDTGVGEVRAGEGVLGLERAFQIAGARTVIMSLWSVEDESARNWMEALYRARLLTGLGTSEAVRDAGLQLLTQRRKSHVSTHPFFWAAFVASGGWK